VSDELINKEIQLYFLLSASLAFKKVSVIQKFKSFKEHNQLLNKKQ